MQIKLKQGFGRAIRLETDTCVVAILDERAARDQRYWKDVLAALPEMPVTQDIHRVEAFYPQRQAGQLLPGGGGMINAKTELQYQIALDILMRMKAAGFVTEDEAESIRRLAMEKYRPITVRE